MNELAKLMTEKRTELNLSLRKAANLIGISHTYLKILETGIDPRNKSATKPTPETLKLISKAYNIDYKYLMSIVGYTSEAEIEKIKIEKAKTLQEDLIELLLKHGIIKSRNIPKDKIKLIEMYIDMWADKTDNKKDDEN